MKIKYFAKEEGRVYLIETESITHMEYTKGTGMEDEELYIYFHENYINLSESDAKNLYNQLEPLYK